MVSRFAPPQESRTRPKRPYAATAPPKQRPPAPCAMSATSSERMEKTLRACARLDARCAMSGATNCRRALTTLAGGLTSDY